MSHEDHVCEQFAPENHVLWTICARKYVNLRKQCSASNLLTNTTLCEQISSQNHVLSLKNLRTKQSLWGICSQNHGLWVVYSRKPRSVSTLLTKTTFFEQCTHADHALWVICSRKPCSVSILWAICSRKHTNTTFYEQFAHENQALWAICSQKHRKTNYNVLWALCSRKPRSVSNLLTKLYRKYHKNSFCEQFTPNVMFCEHSSHQTTFCWYFAHETHVL